MVDMDRKTEKNIGTQCSVAVSASLVPHGTFREASFWTSPARSAANNARKYVNLSVGTCNFTIVVTMRPLCASPSYFYRYSMRALDGLKTG